MTPHNKKYPVKPGQKFGRFTAIRQHRVTKPDGKPGGKSSAWLCRCECGNTAVVFPRALHSGKRDKGCMTCSRQGARVKVGDVYGKFLVLAPTGRGSFLCECECGRQSIVSGKSLEGPKNNMCVECFKKAVKSIAAGEWNE